MNLTALLILGAALTAALLLDVPAEHRTVAADPAVVHQLSRGTFR